MKPSLVTLACLVAVPMLTLSLTPLARAADAPKVSAGDKMFVEKAAVGGMFEVESGKLAQDKAASQDVKDFGSKMVEDHGKANDELKGIATTEGLEVPSALDAKHQKMLDTLNGLSGAAFDKEYLKDMTAGHKATDALMEKEANSGQDTDLKAFAAKTDQTVKMHISMLNDIKAKMK
jgi:putative membrane protein